jgi:hypothetical protein
MERVATENANALAATLTLDGVAHPLDYFKEIHPPTDFDLANWYSFDHCGSSACAVGFAMFHPPFVAEGLGVEYNATWDRLFPTYDGAHDLDAATRFFDLDYHEASALFIPGGRESPYETAAPDAGEVATVLRDFIETGEIVAAHENEDEDDDADADREPFTDEDDDDDDGDSDDDDEVDQNGEVKAP